MADQRKTITVEVVKNLQPGETVWAPSPTGFCCRCQKTAKVYGLKYRFGGRQRWLTIGKHGKGVGKDGKPLNPDNAKKEAERLLGLVAEGIDPADRRDADRDAPNVEKLCKRFLTDHVEAKRKERTATEYRRLIDKIIVPSMGKKLVKDISRSDVSRLHNKHRATPYQANRALAILSKLFNLAEVWGERPDGSNPCRHVERFPEDERERMLSAQELAQLGDALREAETRCEAAEALDTQIVAARRAKDRARILTLTTQRKDLGEITSRSAIAAIRLLVFTGARLSEILGLKWEWIDMERGEARLPDSKTGAKTIHLPAPALAVLADLQREKNNPHVIIGQRAGEALVNLEKPWRAIRKAATLRMWRDGEGKAAELIQHLVSELHRDPTFEECVIAAESADITLPPSLSNLRLHDLRHAFASVAASSGMGLPIIGKMLGHTQAQTTARYAHLAADPVKAAAASVATKIANAMNSKANPIPATVIALPRQGS